jgi:hypothetical protein
MLISVLDIAISIRMRRNRAAHHHANQQTGIARDNHQKHIQRQMIVLMLSSISIFLIATLPLAIYHTVSPTQFDITDARVNQILNLLAGLALLNTLNYTVSVHNSIELVCSSESFYS